ncbi:hypothetical protein EDD15DRAFT_871531 [Pisolithus albus]|nr:hypothetical protein EDD15DRAFT_871531 [Pisolithus albus]
MFRWPSSHHPFSIRDIGSWTDNKAGSVTLHPSFADVSQPRLPSLWPSRMLSLHSSSPAIPNTADRVSHPININIKLNWIVAESPREMANESKDSPRLLVHTVELCSYFPIGSNRSHRVSPPVPMASRVRIPNQGLPVSRLVSLHISIGNCGWKRGSITASTSGSRLTPIPSC